MAEQFTASSPLSPSLVLQFPLGINTRAIETALPEGAVHLLFATEPGKRLLLASNRFPPGSPNLEKAIRFFQQQIAPRAVGSQEDRPRVY